MEQHPGDCGEGFSLDPKDKDIRTNGMTLTFTPPFPSDKDTPAEEVTLTQLTLNPLPVSNTPLLAEEAVTAVPTDLASNEDTPAEEVTLTQVTLMNGHVPEVKVTPSGEVEGQQPLLGGQQEMSEGDLADTETSSRESVVTYEAVLTSLGEFGRYQRRQFLLLGLLYGSGAVQILLTIFTLAVPPHRCALPEVDNDTWRVQGHDHAHLLNLSIPPSPLSPSSSPYDPCHLYQSPDLSPLPLKGNTSAPLLNTSSHSLGSQYGSSPSGHAHNSSARITSPHTTSPHHIRPYNTSPQTVFPKNYPHILDTSPCLPLNVEEGEEEGEGVRGAETGGSGGGVRVGCERYVYDTSTFLSTISTEMDLVCGRTKHRSHLLMMIMLGNLAGNQPAGCLSDLLGRRPVMLLSIVLHLGSALAVSVAGNLPLLMLLLFLLGLSVPGILCTSFILCIEVVGPSYRKWVGYGQMSLWSVGMLVLTALAFALRDWRHLQLTSGLVCLPLLSLYWFVPESPRWLLSRGRREEAKVILQQMAGANGRQVPAAMLEQVQVQEEAGVSILRACTSPVFMLRFAILLFAWLVNSLTYYGLNWSVSGLHGNLFVNFLLMAVMELVSNGLCYLLLDRLGRRYLNCGLMLLAGTTCAASFLPLLYGSPDSRWVTVVLALLGKLGITGSFSTIWIFTSELFPTVLRTSGMGACSICARLGGIVAPFVASLASSLGDEASLVVPLSIYGVLSIAAGLLLLTLPETLHRALPDTLTDALHMDRERRNLEKQTM